MTAARMVIVWGVLWLSHGLFFGVVTLLLWIVIDLLCVGAGIKRKHYRAYLKAARQRGDTRQRSDGGRAGVDPRFCRWTAAKSCACASCKNAAVDQLPLLRRRCSGSWSLGLTGRSRWQGMPSCAPIKLAGAPQYAAGAFAVGYRSSAELAGLDRCVWPGWPTRCSATAACAAGTVSPRWGIGIRRRIRC